MGHETHDRARHDLVAAVLAALAVVAGALVAGGTAASAAADVDGDPVTLRVAGADRYETAVAVALRSWPNGADTVYLAAGDGFADALAAGPAAAAEDAPILLTETAHLPSSTAAALVELAPTEVVVLGEAGAVAEDVVAEAAALTDVTVRRVGGADRYATAAAVAARSWPDGADTAYLVAGDRFADALTAGPVAAADGAPVLLTSPRTLPQTTEAAIDASGAARIVVVGGTDAISDQVAELAGGDRSVTRIAGADRYSTAAELADRLPTTSSAYLATGSTFPDALTATPAAARQGAPTLLSDADCLPDAVVGALETSGAGEVVVLGGERALGSGVLALTACRDLETEAPATSSCLDAAAVTTTIAGDQHERSRLTDLGDSLGIDAGTAVWEQVHDWPVHIEAGPGLCFHGGTIRGTYGDDTSWDTLHSTGAFNLFAPSATVEDLRIHNYGDGIRMLDGAEDFTVSGAHLSYIRDDCVENDDVYGGTVTDSLLDGCYVAFSARPWQDDYPHDGSDRTWSFTDNVVRLEPMPTVYRGETPGHGGFFKWDERAPRISLHGNVFRADQDSNHTTMGIPEGSLAGCSDNVMVWLGDGPYPEPLPDCFTVTTDRAVWDEAVTAWHAAR